MRMRGLLFAAIAALSAGACSAGEGAACTTSHDCASGQTCVGGHCANARDGGMDARIDAHGSDGGVNCQPDGGGCPAGMYCDPTTLRCGTPTEHCTTDSDCHGDTHCVSNACIPYLPGEFNMSCTRPPVPGFLAPAQLCSFTAAPAGDAYPTWLSVSPGLVAADLQLTPPAPDGSLHPSIVAVMHANATYGMGSLQGIIRVIDGATCEQQTVITAHMVHQESGPALGDLDGDGQPEIVATSVADATDPVSGGVVAFKFDRATNQYGCKSTRAAGLFHHCMNSFTDASEGISRAM